MKKKVLIIDESALFRDFLGKKLTAGGLEVLSSADGLDGYNKMLSYQPDLVITDYYLKGKELPSFLKTKSQDKNLASIPVIIVAARIDPVSLRDLSNYGTFKFFTKPIKLDQVLGAVGEILGVRITLDLTPSVLEAHMNEGILFVECGRGLNSEKIALLEYRIAELLKLYAVEVPRILLMISDIELKDQDRPKLKALLDLLISFTRGRVRWIKLLTQNPQITGFLQSFWEYGEISVFGSIDKALDDLPGKKGEGTEARSVLPEAPETFEGEIPLALRLESDVGLPDFKARLASRGPFISIAVVDDDFVVQEILRNTFEEFKCKVQTYDDGKSFVENLPANLDLIILDLMMPGLNGFQVMEYLKKTGKGEIPILVLSALTRKETVMKAMGYGIRSYMIKPLKPDEALRKTLETLESQF